MLKIAESAGLKADVTIDSVYELLSDPKSSRDISRIHDVAPNASEQRFVMNSARLGQSKARICQTEQASLSNTLRMPAPLSRRKSAMVLKSEDNRLVNHISSRLRWHSRSRRRLDWMWLR